MSKFHKTNFKKIISEIEKMELEDQNIWVPIGILEYMYDDDYGWIEKYFNQSPCSRNVELLWSMLNY